VRELQGERAYWDEQVELTAQAVDAIRLNSYYLLSANGAKPDAPKPTPRPGAAALAHTEPQGSLADFAALIGE